jgi:hypothetical protein
MTLTCSTRLLARFSISMRIREQEDREMALPSLGRSQVHPYLPGQFTCHSRQAMLGMHVLYMVVSFVPESRVELFALTEVGSCNLGVHSLPRKVEADERGD